MQDAKDEMHGRRQIVIRAAVPRALVPALLIWILLDLMRYFRRILLLGITLHQPRCTALQLRTSKSGTSPTGKVARSDFTRSDLARSNVGLASKRNARGRVTCSDVSQLPGLDIPTPGKSAPVAQRLRSSNRVL